MSNVSFLICFKMLAHIVNSMSLFGASAKQNKLILQHLCVVLSICVHVVTYFSTCQEYSTQCTTCAALVRRNGVMLPGTSVDCIVNYLEDGMRQAEWDNNVKEYEISKNAKKPTAPISTKKKTAKATETSDHQHTHNLGVWWPEKQWNKSFPDRPCKKSELEKLKGQKGPGVIRDKRYGEPPGTITLSNNNTQATHKTTDLAVSYTDADDESLDAVVAYINGASMPSSSTMKAKADPNDYDGFKLSHAKSQKPQV